MSEGDLPTYTVWYDAAGGTAAPAESEHAPGDTVSLGAEPSRAGYDFLGWQSDDIPPGSEPGGLHQPGGTFTMPPRSVWFTARWEQQDPADVTVTIDPETPGAFGLVLTPNPLEVVRGNSVTVGLAGGSPLAGGSDWQWYLQGEVLAGQSGSSLTLGTADLLGDYNLGVSVVYQGVLYSGDAVIRVSEGDLSTYTVWYDAAGGTAAPPESEHAPGDTVSLGAEPSRAGYDFLGWQSDDIPPGSEPGGLHQSGGTFTMPPRSVWFTARWEQQDPADVTVTIDLETPGAFGLVLTPNPLEVVRGNSVTVGLAGGSPLAGGSDWQWYLQGEVLAGQSGSSLTLGTADLLGDYN
ncbi:InlB B-repeat-containing protein, partial [Alkalispirochaeta sphaeroplastigenens]|uniref:InlB B-repeat-containing protein n=1 Tax=Alkalispirochaeta sphaeroplastigenens TaxID=1187066 RepID=UPI0015E15DC5